MRGPLHTNLDPLKGAPVPLSWLLTEYFEPAATPVSRNLSALERLQGQGAWRRSGSLNRSCSQMRGPSFAKGV